jgi:hypothetical protein
MKLYGFGCGVITLYYLSKKNERHYNINSFKYILAQPQFSDAS